MAQLLVVGVFSETFTKIGAGACSLGAPALTLEMGAASIAVFFVGATTRFNPTELERVAVHETKAP